MLPCVRLVRVAVFACGLLLRFGTADAGGDSGYSPVGKPPQARPFAYFCRADTLDHSAYYMTPVMPAPDTRDRTFESKLSIEWEQYMVQLHGKRVVVHPGCVVGLADQMPAAMDNIKQGQRAAQPRVPIVEVIWHSAIAAGKSPE